MINRFVVTHPIGRMGSRWCVLGCLFIFHFAGCGPRETPIQGTVTLDGDPLAGVQILFDQPDASGGKSFAGKTNEQGFFVMHPVDGEPDGEVAGNYRVTLTTAVADRDATEHTPLPPERIPQQYRNGSVQFEVPIGGTDKADFELTTRK